MAADVVDTSTAQPDEGVKPDTKVAGDSKPVDKTPDASKREPTPDKSGEDARTKGLLADLQKERKARQELEARVKQREADYEREQKRVRALAGVDPVNPEEAEAAEIRARFAKLYPDLAGLTKEDIEAIRDLRSQSGELQAAVQNHWDRHVQVVFGQLEDFVSEAIGADLTDRQRRTLRTAYANQAQSDPEFAAAYEQGDVSHLEQFAKDFVEDWFKPAQRKVTAAALGQTRRVPNGRDRSVLQQPDKKIDVSDPKAVEDVLVAGFKARGGEFGRRR